MNRKRHWSCDFPQPATMTEWESPLRADRTQKQACLHSANSIKFRRMHNNASIWYSRTHSRRFLTGLTRPVAFTQSKFSVNFEETIGSGDGSNIVTVCPIGKTIAPKSGEGNPMKTQSSYPGSIFQAQGSSEQFRSSSLSLRKRLAIAFVTLAILSVALWAVIEHALRVTSGGR